MFYYIEGVLALKSDTFAVVDVGGVGYEVYTTKTTLEELGETGQKVKLYTYLNIKMSSDTVSLYGFKTLEEKRVFEMILSVSGIGAKTAVSLLSGVSPSKFAMCVVCDDSKYLSDHTQGLGPKGAKRIILELKDKFKNADISDMPDDEIFEDKNDGENEALSALMVLGYSREAAKRALAGASGSVEDKIKYALKRLMK